MDFMWHVIAYYALCSVQSGQEIVKILYVSSPLYKVSEQDTHQTHQMQVFLLWAINLTIMHQISIICIYVLVHYV